MELREGWFKGSPGHEPCGDGDVDAMRDCDHRLQGDCDDGTSSWGWLSLGVGKRGGGVVTPCSVHLA